MQWQLQYGQRKSCDIPYMYTVSTQFTKPTYVYTQDSSITDMSWMQHLATIFSDAPHV